MIAAFHLKSLKLKKIDEFVTVIYRRLSSFIVCVLSRHYRTDNCLSVSLIIIRIITAFIDLCGGMLSSLGCN